MRIVVVGGGIAGLTCALALSGRGHDITVCERRTGFGEAGAGIQLSPNATGVLLRLGLGTALGRDACEPDGITVRALRSGREIGAVALGPAMRDRHGAPFLSLARADLHTILLDAVRTKRDVRIRVGRGAAGLHEGGDEVEVETGSAAGSRDRFPADLVIGADGLWSEIRSAIGDARTPRYAGYVASRATIAMTDVPPDVSRTGTGLWLGRGRHVVHYPVSGGRRLNLVVVTRSGQAVEGWSAEESGARVGAALSRSAEELRAIVAAPESWAVWSLYDLPARTLAAGRVALVGDAAHPVLPYLAQGGSLAIEDAAALAARLGEAREVPAALRLYAADRRARVLRVQREARRNGLVYHAGGPVALVRDLAMRRLGPNGMGERYAWLYGWRPPEPEPAA